MKIIVTHASPDLDAITSVWLIKKFFEGWNEAEVRFVPAGTRLGEGSGNLQHIAEDVRPPKENVVSKDSSSLSERRHTTVESKVENTSESAFSASASVQVSSFEGAIEQMGNDEVIHVDTGLGPLDHHQTSDKNVSAASRTWDFVQEHRKHTEVGISSEHVEAISRIVKIVVDTDHFKEVFWDNPTADYHEFSFLGLLDGLKLYKQNQDMYYVEFGIECLEALLHQFENRIWAEKEIAAQGTEFQTQWGKGMGFETINDSVLKLAQKMGYTLVVRKDPRKGYVRIKARPQEKGVPEVDLTPVYDTLKKKDPDATWFLHVSKKMLLNGTAKNPKMRPTTLSLEEIIEVLKNT